MSFDQFCQVCEMVTAAQKKGYDFVSKKLYEIAFAKETPQTKDSLIRGNMDEFIRSNPGTSKISAVRKLREISGAFDGETGLKWAVDYINANYAYVNGVVSIRN